MSRKAEVGIWVRLKDQASRQLKGLRGGFSRVKSAVLSVHGAVIALASGIAIKIGVGALKAWGLQQQSIIKLNSTLKETGRFTREVSRDLVKSAQDLQKVTVHGDEAIIGATASLGALATQLSGPELAEAQKVIIGLADQFFGGDLEGAAQLLGKTIGSTTNALTRYGIQLDVNASQEQKLQEIMKQTGVFFGNSQAMALGLTGGMTQLGNVLGDTREEFGAIISELLGLEKGAGSATEKVSGLNTALEENRSRNVAWGRAAITFAKAVLGTFTGVVRGAFELGLGIGHALSFAFHQVVEAVFSLANRAIRGINFFISGINKIPGVNIGEIGLLDAEGQRRKSLSALDDMKQAGADLLNTIQDIGDGWLRVVDAAAEATNTQKGAMAAGEGAARGPAPGGRVPQPTAPSRPEMGLPGGFEMAGVDLPDPVEIRSLGQQIGDSMKDALGPAMDLEEVLGSGLVSAMQEFAGASGLAAKGFEEAFLGSIGQIASALAQMYLAQAIAAVADFISNPILNASSLAAAAKYTAAAAGLFTLSGALGGGSGGGGGGRSGSSQAFRSTDSLAGGADRGEATIIIEGGLLDTSDPRQMEALKRAMEAVSSRRITIRGR